MFSGQTLAGKFSLTEEEFALESWKSIIFLSLGLIGWLQCLVANDLGWLVTINPSHV